MQLLSVLFYIYLLMHLCCRLLFMSFPTSVLSSVHTLWYLWMSFALLIEQLVRHSIDEAFIFKVSV